jgi:uncharacterized protein YukE
MSWTPQDPGQGDPAVIAALAADLQTQADDAATAARQLRGLHEHTTDTVWRGEAADTFRDRIAHLPTHLDTLHTSYTDAAAGIRAYAAAVTQIADDTTTAHQRISTAQHEHQAAASAQAAWTPPLDPTTGHPLPGSLNPHDDTVAAATATLTFAQSALHDLADDRTAADHRAIAALKQAHHTGIRNKPWWHTALATASTALAKITTVLIAIAIIAVVVLAIVQPELIPALLVIAGESLSALSAAQLAVDTTRLATGDDVSWGSLAVDALGTLPGIDELAAAGRLGAFGETTADAASKLSELARTFTGSAASKLAKFVAGGAESASGIERTATTVDDLAQMHTDVVQSYTGTSFRQLNTLARTGGQYMSPQEVEALSRLSAKLSTALAMLPNYEGVVYRGTTLDEDLIAKYQPGSIVREDAFTSTSTDTPFPGNTQFTITAVTGKEISKWSLIPDENEVLFDKGTRFRVMSKDFDDGICYIHMRELPR